MKRKLAVLLSVLLCAFGLTACSSSSASDTASEDMAVYKTEAVALIDTLVNEQKTLDELKAEANDEDEAAAFEAGFSAWEDAKLLSEAAHDDVPQSEHDHRGQRDAAGQQKHFLRFFLVDRLVLLRLLPLRRDCLHGGDILRRLVGIGAAQILDAEIKVYVWVLAELLQVGEHGVRRRIAAVDVRGHRLHADLFQRLGHVGVDLPRGERHAA